MPLRSIHRSTLTNIALAGALLGAAACGSSDNTTGTGSIGLSLAPAAATVQVGGATVVTGTLIRTNFTGDVAISVSGAPAGVTGTVTTSPVNGGNTAVVSIAVASTAAIGVDTLVVHASAAGFSDATAPFILTVAAATSNTFGFTVGTPTLTAAVGGTAVTGLALTRTGTVGNVAFGIDNLPTGVTASFNPSPATGALDTLTLTVGANATPGTTVLTVRGTVAGLTDVVTPLSLTVTAASGFTLVAAPTQVAVTVGGAAATSSITATRTGGFAGVVTYTTTLSGLQGGLTAAVTPTANADVNTLTVTPTAGLVAGTYSVIVHANATGQTERTVTVPVVVTAGGVSGSFRLDYSSCPAASKPIFVAVQDGTGAWIRATGTGDVYGFAITSSKGAVAVVTQTGSVFSTSVTYLAASESSAFTGSCTVTGSKTIAAPSIAGLVAGDAAFLSLGSGSGSVFAPLTSGSITNVATSGTFDLVGSKSQLASSSGARILLRRGIDVGATSSLAAIDFNGAESFAPATASVNVAGVPAGETSIVRLLYNTGTACTSNTLFPTIANTGSTVTVMGVPTANQVATDFHFFQVSASTATSTPSTQSVLLSQHALSAQTITLPTAVTGASVTVASTSPYKRLQTTTTLPTEFTSGSLGYSDAAGNSFTTTQTAGYLAGSHTLTVVAPDLSTVSGFLTSWAPSGTVTWTVSGVNSTLTSSIAAFCTEGATVRASSQSGTI